MKSSDPFDPKGLMKDAFIIEGITISECRSIFLDWVLGIPAERDVRDEVQILITHYARNADQSHPMILTLNEALQETQTPRRRGGRQSRLSQKNDKR